MSALLNKKQPQINQKMINDDDRLAPNPLVCANLAFDTGLYNFNFWKKWMKNEACEFSCVLPLNSIDQIHYSEPVGMVIPTQNAHNKIVVNPVHSPIDDGTFIVYDLETSGLYGWFDSITEIGAIKFTVKDGKIVHQENFDVLCKQEKPLKPFISRLTHLTTEKCNQSPYSEKQALELFFKFSHTKEGVAIPCIGHNILNFDWRFINKKCEKYGLKMWINPQIDTMQISKLLFNRPNHQLKTLTRDLGLTYDLSVQHRADADCDLNMKVWVDGLIPLLKDKGIKYIDEINNQRNINFASQQRGHSLMVVPKNKMSLEQYEKLSKLAQNRVWAKKDVLALTKDNFMVLPYTINNEIIDSALSDRHTHFVKILKTYDQIMLPSPKNLNYLIGHQHESHVFNINPVHFDWLMNKKAELQADLKTSVETSEIIRVLKKHHAGIFLSAITKQNEQLIEKFNNNTITNEELNQIKPISRTAFNEIIKAIPYLLDTTANCEYLMKENEMGETIPSNQIEITVKNSAPIAQEELAKVYTYIFDTCKKLNKEVIIANPVYAIDEFDQEQLKDYLNNKNFNHLSRYFKTIEDTVLYPTKIKDLMDEFNFYKDKKYLTNIIINQPLNLINLMNNQKEKLEAVSKAKKR